jgi:uncharacterized protein YaaR (DUF327 family)
MYSETSDIEKPVENSPMYTFLDKIDTKLEHLTKKLYPISVNTPRAEANEKSPSQPTKILARLEAINTKIANLLNIIVL